MKDMIEAFVKGIHKLIEVHPEASSNIYHVEFTGFGDFALEILVNVYFKNPDWGVEQSSKHILHIAILKFAKELGVEFAFPSQTLMMEEFPEKKGVSMEYDTDSTRTDSLINDSVMAFKANFEEK